MDELLNICENPELLEAEKYVKENSNPHVYDRPYSDLYEGGSHVEKVELGD
ncbi:hypothetical protein FD29_GL001736 [Companilactobacillus mindensis DSM 14500]|uniref:Uncharacterized protein n=1 Tax=Companilactobacillus mindensis DSM 14500 TaxID=1423770 RepID=A0A0R1QXB4_9LACO|nr:hypothetical protein [Companilactobacillus mindensis]KRL45979.1 hypothetical protein FD29_GL001736 [Companilactobacillus mindensis DSM 14500]GEO78125.1 hypothetical protein LMI01_04560 [Companilactobacillus mindensis]